MNLPIPLEVQLRNGDWFWIMDYITLPDGALCVQVGWSGGDPRRATFAIIPDWPTY